MADVYSDPAWDRAIAERDAEITRLRAEVEQCRTLVAEWVSTGAEAQSTILKLLEERTRLNAEVARMREALEKIGGINGPYSDQWPESQEGYASFAVVTSREALTPSHEPRT